ncbi:hypothetical protein ADU90_09060 [Clostridium botulinum]|uniref:Uncharacterized protein n=1 Tax=Clostridium botulinum C/D str. DC5 TaxID=1443128 RepID=A0A0A0HV58_CLOBO|nr:hypothetical protein Z956_13105 [Clostridium botulinum D str. CCUG 7971]KGM93069.1 hypothetical protein Z955_16200 [Clostridium botulinum C/D str. DC5]KOC51088.1 hypothetical protein ADU88_00690 [Clostridium botulinum]OOV55203.1 hypothetical protein B0673_08950 [Clostridium botulinum D/C]KOC51536.1 hypothetical protein ADU89_13480 [Clostridium botulinum]
MIIQMNINSEIQIDKLEDLHKLNLIMEENSNWCQALVEFTINVKLKLSECLFLLRKSYCCDYNFRLIKISHSKDFSLLWLIFYLFGIKKKVTK